VIEKIIHLKPNSGGIETWIALHDDEVIGHIYMKIENEKRIKFLDAWVHQNFRRRGIYRRLWDVRWEYVTQNYKDFTVYAWCKENSLPLLIEKDFTPGESVTYVERKI